jgi:hypothetical protein
MTGILWYILVFYLGMLAGFLLKAWMNYKFRDYSGTIYVNRDEVREKTVYSLELNEYPEELVFKKVVIFKVDAPDEKS